MSFQRLPFQKSAKLYSCTLSFLVFPSISCVTSIPCVTLLPLLFVLSSRPIYCLESFICLEYLGFCSSPGSYARWTVHFVFSVSFVGSHYCWPVSPRLQFILSPSPSHFFFFSFFPTSSPDPNRSPNPNPNLTNPNLNPSLVLLVLVLSCLVLVFVILSCPVSCLVLLNWIFQIYSLQECYFASTFLTVIVTVCSNAR